MAMEKKGSSSAFFLLLLLFFSGNMSFSEARRCRAQSFTFKGICYSSHSCALVCKKEGYETGHCSRGFCTLLKPANAEQRAQSLQVFASVPTPALLCVSKKGSKAEINGHGKEVTSVLRSPPLLLPPPPRVRGAEPRGVDEMSGEEQKVPGRVQQRQDLQHRLRGGGVPGRVQQRQDLQHRLRGGGVRVRSLLPPETPLPVRESLFGGDPRTAVPNEQELIAVGFRRALSWRPCRKAAALWK
ncbi:hypothetical protein HPP92_013203 [Vanilla planifolia]|uniref:Knottins-like domain-containing protein n=1 Tax=Vanilla planifolia TaxID=51239 RepID=A0A835UW88_VANPL|nr:hypothetical protein HPP92_013203 [Vanilla planifolia]